MYQACEKYFRILALKSFPSFLFVVVMNKICFVTQDLGEKMNNKSFMYRKNHPGTNNSTNYYTFISGNLKECKETEKEVNLRAQWKRRATSGQPSAMNSISTTVFLAHQV